MALSGTITSTVKLLHTNVLSLLTYAGNLSKTYQKDFATSDISKVYHGTRTVSAPETLDVTSGLSDGFNNALNFGTVKELLIHNKHATATLTVGGGTNALFSQLPVITAGGCVHLTLDMTVSGSAKNILVTPSASLDYDIVIVGS